LMDVQPQLHKGFWFNCLGGTVARTRRSGQRGDCQRGKSIL
jgi:hypothetical protein